MYVYIIYALHLYWLVIFFFRVFFSGFRARVMLTPRNELGWVSFSFLKVFDKDSSQFFLAYLVKLNSEFLLFFVC